MGFLCTQETHGRPDGGGLAPDVTGYLPDARRRRAVEILTSEVRFEEYRAALVRVGPSSQPIPLPSQHATSPPSAPRTSAVSFRISPIPPLMLETLPIMLATSSHSAASWHSASSTPFCTSRGDRTPVVGPRRRRARPFPLRESKCGCGRVVPEVAFRHRGTAAGG
jgi:hypothetical protein